VNFASVLLSRAAQELVENRGCRGLELSANQSKTAALQGSWAVSCGQISGLYNFEISGNLQQFSDVPGDCWRSDYRSRDAFRQRVKSGSSTGLGGEANEGEDAACWSSRLAQHVSTAGIFRDAV
jgi:hypothetical protein